MYFSPNIKILFVYIKDLKIAVVTGKGIKFGGVGGGGQVWSQFWDYNPPPLLDQCAVGKEGIISDGARVQAESCGRTKERSPSEEDSGCRGSARDPCCQCRMKSSAQSPGPLGCYPPSASWHPGLGGAAGRTGQVEVGVVK